MRNVNAARSAPAAVSTTHGMTCSFGRLVEVLETLARRLGVARQVEVAPVVDALQFLPAEREAVLDVDRLLRVVGQLVRRVLAQAQAGGLDAEALVPGAPLREPLLEGGRGRGLRADEVLHLHLFELAHPEDEVAGTDLVAERLSDLGDPERQLLARRLLDVLEVDVRALGRLRAEIDDRGVLLDRAHERLEHEVEPSRRRKRAAVDRAPEAEPFDDRRVAEIGRREVFGAGQFVEAESAVVGRAFDQWVAERADVAGGHPDLRVHEDPGIEPDDVVPLLDHRAPPGPLDVVLELDAQRTVVPDRVDPAIDLAGREDEPAPLRQRDDRLELGDGGRDIVGIGLGVLRHGRSGLGPGVSDASRARRRSPRATLGSLARDADDGSHAERRSTRMPPPAHRGRSVAAPAASRGPTSVHLTDIDPAGTVMTCGWQSALRGRRRPGGRRYRRCRPPGDSRARTGRDQGASPPSVPG